jgi:sugar phosphate isomerase/epimerase
MADRAAFSISQITTLSSTFAEDVRTYAEAGIDGIGVWELKLAPDGDAESLEVLEEAGLARAAAIPLVPSILPLPLMEGPSDPQERVDAICGSLHRLAPFHPSGIVCLTGPVGDRDREGAWETMVEALRTIGDEAERAGVRIGVEPINRVGGENWTFISSIPEAVELIEEADRPALGIQFDAWHLWNTETLLDDIARERHRFVGVHVSDWREPTRTWADRILPGGGIAPLPAILGALDEAGWDGPYDLEIFSDNGAFGMPLPDSLWDVPADTLVARAKASFEEAWSARIRPPLRQVPHTG